MLERISRLCERMNAPDKAAKAWERILVLDPQHIAAARALVPIYRRAEKWARLLSTYEVLLAHAPSDADKLQLHLEIRAGHADPVVACREQDVRENRHGLPTFHHANDTLQRSQDLLASRGELHAIAFCS